MKPNAFLQDIQTDINIQKGLKILQFGTQFYLERTFLRNCPLTQIQKDKKSDTNKKLASTANIVAQLNDFLINPSSYKPSRSKKYEEELMRQSNKKQSTAKTAQKITTKAPKAQIDSQINQKIALTQPPIPIPIKKQQNKQLEVNRSITQKSQKKEPKEPNLSALTAKIAQISQPSPQKSKKQKQIQSPEALSSSKTSKQPSLSQSSLNQSSQKSSSFHHQGKTIKEDSINSYYSECTPMAPIKEANEREQQISRDPPSFKIQPKQRSVSSGFSLSDFTSIKDDTSLGNSTILRYAAQTKQPQQLKQSSLRQKSEPLSFLNKSISQIKQSQSKTYLLQPQANQTELNILKQISQSFSEEEHIKHLLKLESFEMEEKFLLHRMEKRLQNCAKNIDDIRTINWKSLQMPNTQIFFKRPDYAHCIESLK